MSLTSLTHAACRKTLAAALLLAVLPGVALADNEANRPRTVTVTGEAELAVKPDRARLRMGVFEVNTDVKAAEAKVNGVVRAYVAQAKKLGAKEEQIATTGLSIQPEYTWDEATRTNKLTGYRVSRDIELRLEALDKLGDYLLAATQAGVNQLQPAQLEYSKSKDLLREALADAAKDARAKAEVLATTLGTKLGGVRTLTENGGGSPAPMPMAAFARGKVADGNAEMGIETGQIRYSATVNAEFFLVD